MAVGRTCTSRPGRRRAWAVLDAWHSLDVVGNLDRRQPATLFGAGPTEEVAALAAHMRAAWTAFATRGDPGWPAYEPKRRRTRIFAARPTVDRCPEAASGRIRAGQPLSAFTLLEK